MNVLGTLIKGATYQVTAWVRLTTGIPATQVRVTVQRNLASGSQFDSVASSSATGVTDSAWTARTNGQGVAAFPDAPNAPGRITVWHPYLRAPGGLLQQGVSAAQRSASFRVRLRAPPPAMAMDY